jgi:hypothetical protein
MNEAYFLLVIFVVASGKDRGRALPMDLDGSGVAYQIGT